MDIYAPLRSGTDIAFIGGMIKHILDKDKWFKDYVINYTNASYLVGEKFDFKDGLFSGFNAEKRVLRQDQSGLTWWMRTGFPRRI